MKCFDLAGFTAKGVVLSEKDGVVTAEFSKEGGRLYTDCPKGTIAGAEIGPDSYIVMDVRMAGDYSGTVSYEFWENGNTKGSDMRLKMGLIKGLKTRLALPVEAVKGERLFLKRTPGKLKTVAEGRPISPDKITRFGICAPPSPSGITLEIYGLYMQKGEPEYPVPDVKLVDEFGQQKNKDWKGKTKSFEELKSKMRAEYEKEYDGGLPNRSEYGGYTKKRFEPTGFFALRHDGRRYYLADPDGYAFFSSGIDCVSIDGDCNLEGIEKLCDYLPDESSGAWHKRGPYRSLSFHKLNLMRVFGDDYYNAWMKITKRRFKEWGINTVACWSDLNFARWAKIPYVYIFNGYPETKHAIFRDFPDVFSEEYRNSAREWAKRQCTFSDDKYLIGYFMRNEPNWAFVNNLNIAAVMLAKEEFFESKAALADFLKKKYGDISSLNSAWGSGFSSFEDLYKAVDVSAFGKTAHEDLNLFSAEMIREYIRVPALAIKEFDKNHLNLGVRYAWLSSDNLVAGSEYFDIFSFNCYNMEPTGAIDEIVRRVNKPVIIGEFHFGALDRGLDATGIRAVSSQEERAVAYRYYMERAAAHPYCLGAHYFMLNDQAYLGRFDGENYQIGLVDVCQAPYEEFVKGITEVNAGIYEIAEHERETDPRVPEEIPRIFY